MSRVVVVGAGIAGMACARELVSAGVTVSVRERASSVGGRMASPRLSGRPVDIGASYLTARDPAFVQLVEDWCDRGLAHRWTDRFSSLSDKGFGEPKVGPWRYGTPGGLRSLVKDLAATAPRLPVIMRSPVSQVAAGPTIDGERADAVVLAMPDPQAKRLLDPALAAIRAEVTGRQWEPVLALTASFSRRSWRDFDGAFVSGDPVLSWIADDGSRRGDAAPVLVAHSTPAFAGGHLTAPEKAKPELLEALQRLIECGPAAQARLHRWTFARPADSREEPYFFGADRVGLAGDGWGSARIETAWLSGRALGRHIAAELAA